MSKFALGKYRGIMIAVVIFLLVDTVVLMANFYISYQIAEDAVSINLAGRQRMLSQRMAKSIYMLDVIKQDALFLERSLQELQLSQALFDQTLHAFQRGGLVNGADNKPVNIKPVTTQLALDNLREAQVIWPAYQQSILRLIKAQASDEFSYELSKALVIARTHNLTLLELMNGLAVDLEYHAAAKAHRLRTIQTLGLLLAMINFLGIVFYCLRKLREHDLHVETSHRETSEILETVNEGLFLIDRDLMIGERHSAALNSILGQVSLTGKSFQRVLENLIDAKHALTVKNFIDVLFDERVKTKLITELNPLKSVAVNVHQGGSVFVSRHLRFDFARAYQGNSISHVLVTVVDITEQVKLAKEVTEIRERNESQLDILTGLLHAHPILLKEFIDNAYIMCNRINNMLRSPTENTLQLSEKAKNFFKEMHHFKAEAATLKLNSFENIAHKMEDVVAVLQQKASLETNDFLPFTLQLDSLITYTQQVEQLAIKLNQLGGGLLSELSEKTTKNITGSRLTDGWENLHEFVQHTAQCQHKLVRLVVSGLHEIRLEPSYQQQLREICIQLLRNAIVHGIEKPYDREMSEKAIQGRVDLRLAKISDTEMELTVTDDGCGINCDLIREKALASGRWSETEMDSWDSKKITSLLFHEGMSTADSSNVDARRGMSIIINHVNAHRGKITVSTRSGRYTQFVITLPLVLALSN